MEGLSKMDECRKKSFVSLPLSLINDLRGVNLSVLDSSGGSEVVDRKILLSVLITSYNAGSQSSISWEWGKKVWETTATTYQGEF